MDTMITEKQIASYNTYRDTSHLLSSPRVSAVLITYNEEHIIHKTLSQLYWCDEIVVIDSYSTDNTVSICKKFGCRVYYREFDGYGSQKKFAVSKARNEWVLCIDADEIPTSELIAEISENLHHPGEYVGFRFRMNLVFLDKEFVHGKESDRYFLRLFKKDAGWVTDDKVHESIKVFGPVKELDETIKHYSYSSLHQCIEKLNRYSSYSAEMAFRAGKKKSLLAVLFGLPFNFFKYYILERNFLNGLKGFYWSVVSSYYHFLKYVKLNELRKKQIRLH